MGYLAIIVLVFYIVTAFLMWFSGMFISQESPMREQVDIGVLVLSAIITAAMSIYGRRQLYKEKQQGVENNFAIGKIVRILGAVGVILLTLGAAARAFKYLKGHTQHVDSAVVGSDAKK